MMKLITKIVQNSLKRKIRWRNVCVWICTAYICHSGKSPILTTRVNARDWWLSNVFILSTTPSTIPSAKDSQGWCLLEWKWWMLYNWIIYFEVNISRSISWLLMPWLLTSPGHQQPWYWLCRIRRSRSYLRKDFKYLCHINVEEWHKMSIHVYIHS